MIQYDQTQLDGAKFGTSKNESISTVFKMLQFYNSGQVADGDKPAVLERMLAGLGAWVTSHQPKETALNELRWDAMEHLAQAIADEAAAVGVKLLSGPADWKKIGQKVNPQNPRATAVVRELLAGYVRSDASARVRPRPEIQRVEGTEKEEGRHLSVEFLGFSRDVGERPHSR